MPTPADGEREYRPSPEAPLEAEREMRNRLESLMGFMGAASGVGYRLRETDAADGVERRQGT